MATIRRKTSVKYYPKPKGKSSITNSKWYANAAVKTKKVNRSGIKG